MQFVDTHCHLNHRDFDDDREAAVQRAASSGVDRLLVIGYDRDSSRRALDLSLAGSPVARLYAVIGIHPESAAEWDESSRQFLTGLYGDAGGQVVAYGEIGLDYHWESIPRNRQQAVFAEQIAFAEALRPTRPLPIIIHCRDAMDDVLAVLAQSGTRCPIVMHCFTGDAASARRCLDAGCHLGIGGVATFKKTEEVRAAVAYAPLDRLLLETDCPYLAPQRWRGKRNEPSYLPAIAETVAAVKGLTVEEIAAVTTLNAMRLFGLE